MFCIRLSNKYLYWPNRGLSGPTNIDKTGFVIPSRKGKGVCENRYLFETFKKSVFVFSLKAIHHVCLTKQELCVAKQSLCIFQAKAHSYKERPLSSSNRASVLTKHGICICQILLFVFFMRLCLNPDRSATSGISKFVLNCCFQCNLEILGWTKKWSSDQANLFLRPLLKHYYYKVFSDFPKYNQKVLFQRYLDFRSIFH